MTLTTLKENYWEDDMKDTIGRRLREFREVNLGITRKAVSHMSGINEDTIRRLERDGNMPNVYTLCLLCKAYELTPNDFIPEWMYKEVK